MVDGGAEGKQDLQVMNRGYCPNQYDGFLLFFIFYANFYVGLGPDMYWMIK